MEIIFFDMILFLLNMICICRYQEETAFTDPLGVSVTSPLLVTGEAPNIRPLVRRPAGSLRRQARLDTEDPGQPQAPSGLNMGKYQVRSPRGSLSESRPDNSAMIMMSITLYC